MSEIQTRLNTQMHVNEILPKISENSLENIKEGVGYHGGNVSTAGKGPGRIMNLKMFKKKQEQERRRDKLSRNVASLTIGSKSGKESLTGTNVTIDKDSSIHVVIPKRFTNSLGRPIEDESKHESSIETQKIHYLQNLSQIDLTKAVRGIAKNKNKKGYEYPPMVI